MGDNIVALSGIEEILNNSKNPLEVMKVIETEKLKTYDIDMGGWNFRTRIKSAEINKTGLLDITLKAYCPKHPSEICEKKFSANTGEEMYSYFLEMIIPFRETSGYHS